MWKVEPLGEQPAGPVRRVSLRTSAAARVLPSCPRRAGTLPSSPPVRLPSDGNGNSLHGSFLSFRSPSRTPKTRNRVGGKFLHGPCPPPPVSDFGSLPLSLRCRRAASLLLGGRPAEVAASSGALGREMGQAVTRRLGAGARAAPRRAMDSRTPRAQDALAAPTPPAASTGRKPKAKAPLPPAETRNLDASSVDDTVDSSACIMEQKENTIDKDIELSVVLPGDIIKSTTVHGSKPMMDLLIFLCAQYHLNPSSYTIDLQSAENNPIKFKPNTPIGMLEVEKVILKPKILDKKKPMPIIPEKTVRVVINFKKTQKTIVRVSPHAPLQELAPIICSKCEFDPLHTLLLKDYQSQEPLDLTKSLNDLGLRELYAMDVSRESCQISQNLDIMKEKENKGFFSFFQRSKKKREQTASAPATPLVSKHRPTFTRSNTISKPYISNTLPSDAPKKRRAPLPPMPGSQSAPQDLAHIQERPASCVVKSLSVDETEKSPCGAGIVRTGSLQLSSASAGSSSLKRTKRKAPSPPSKTPLHQSDENSPVTALQAEHAVPSDGVLEANSPEGLPSPDFTSSTEASLGPGLPSHEHCTVPKLRDEDSLSECPGTPEAAGTPLTSGISSDHSLEEIDEKEELSAVPKDEAENISLKSQDIPFGSTDIINTLKNDPDSVLGNVAGEPSQNSKEEKQEARNTDGQGPHIMEYNASSEERVVDSVRNLKSLGPKQENVDQNEVIVIPPNTEDHMKNGVRRTEINVGGVAKNKNVDMEVDRPSNYQAHKTDTAENLLAASLVQDQKLNQPSEEKTKMQDAAIQTVPSTDGFDGNHRDHNLSNFKVNESVHTPSNNKSTQHSSSSPQDSVDASRKFRSQGPLNVQSENQLTIKDPMYTHGNDDLLPPIDGIDKNSAISHVKNYPLYKQDYDPKPKPSNEITREYIPKIGMTTYKIVPPKSLEIVNNWESETTGYKDDQEVHTLGRKHTHESVKETEIQTEDLVISESPKEPQADVQLKLTPRTEPQVHSVESSPHIATGNPLKPAPRMTKDAGTAPFVPNLEDINNILESKLKSRVSNPQTKPSFFFLQMQKRVSGHYVTSAAARSVHVAPNPTPKELIKKEEERDVLPPPEQTLSPLSKTAPSPPQPHIQSPDDDRSSQKPTETLPPSVAPRPAPLPASQLAAQNLKTLKTFGAPRPYSSSAPSPFALAVVKRSQSLSKVRPEPSGEGAAAPPPPDTEEGKAPSVHKFVGIPQPCVRDEGNNSAHNEQNSQIPSPTDCPSFILKRQSSLTFQSSDPEQIRQSLLTAIRSGEAAAKLKRVTVPSNTISVNGRSRLSPSMSPAAQDGH
ncbi:cordon-bleu protein-like 1 isoform X5 [Ursus arctos]|uniref:cordon-bleu protein-like 1 isoform X5 n=1 Tax=Ursus arctos TaxID=9644 RepID=UPI002549C0FD|nr:cordon-bleu protein-like 1 isoform X5 [Ursus arctos]